MSWSHFQDIHYQKLSEDIKLNNSSFWNPIRTVAKSENQEDYLAATFTNPAVRDYWKLKWQSYRQEYETVSFPLIHSTSKLINVYELDIDVLQGLTCEDTLHIYFPEGKITWKLTSNLNSTYSEGPELNIRWSLIRGEAYLTQFWELLEDTKQSLNLTEKNKLWSILWDAKLLQRNLMLYS